MRPRKLTIIHRAQLLVRRRTDMVHRVISDAHRQGGLPAALGQAVRLVGELVARPAHRWREHRLDRRWNLDTRAEVDAGGSAAAMFDDAVDYSPIPVHHFRNLLQALPVDHPPEFTFVDLGCGKGRTLVLAARHGFARVIGVELDPRLSGIAHNNAAAYAAASPGGDPVISVVNTDAATHTFPPVPTVVFMFNPFGADTLASVAQGLERSLKETPRRLVIGYFNPVHRGVLDASPVLRRRDLTRHWAIYEAVG